MKNKDYSQSTLSEMSMKWLEVHSQQWKSTLRDVSVTCIFIYVSLVSSFGTNAQFFLGGGGAKI